MTTATRVELHRESNARWMQKETQNMHVAPLTVKTPNTLSALQDILITELTKNPSMNEKVGKDYKDNLLYDGVVIFYGRCLTEIVNHLTYDNLAAYVQYLLGRVVQCIGPILAGEKQSADAAKHLTDTISEDLDLNTQKSLVDQLRAISEVSGSGQKIVTFDMPPINTQCTATFRTTGDENPPDALSVIIDTYDAKYAPIIGMVFLMYAFTRANQIISNSRDKIDQGMLNDTLRCFEHTGASSRDGPPSVITSSASLEKFDLDHLSVPASPATSRVPSPHPAATPSPITISPLSASVPAADKEVPPRMGDLGKSSIIPSALSKDSLASASSQMAHSPIHNPLYAASSIGNRVINREQLRSLSTSSENATSPSGIHLQNAASTRPTAPSVPAADWNPESHAVTSSALASSRVPSAPAASAAVPPRSRMGDLDMSSVETPVSPSAVRLDIPYVASTMNGRELRKNAWATENTENTGTPPKRTPTIDRTTPVGSPDGRWATPRPRTLGAPGAQGSRPSTATDTAPTARETPPTRPQSAGGAHRKTTTHHIKRKKPTNPK